MITNKITQDEFNKKHKTLKQKFNIEPEIFFNIISGGGFIEYEYEQKRGSCYQIVLDTHKFEDYDKFRSEYERGWARQEKEGKI